MSSDIQIHHRERVLLPIRSMHLKACVNLLRQLNNVFENGFAKRRDNFGATHCLATRRTRKLACRFVCMLLVDVDHYLRRANKPPLLPHYTQIIVKDCIHPEKSKRIKTYRGEDDERLCVKSVISFLPFEKHRLFFVRKTRMDVIKNCEETKRKKKKRDFVATNDYRDEISHAYDLLSNKLSGCVYLVDKIMDYNPIQHPVALLYRNSYFFTSKLPPTFLLAAHSKGGIRKSMLTGEHIFGDYKLIVQPSLIKN